MHVKIYVFIILITFKDARLMKHARLNRFGYLVLVDGSF